jgi:glycine/D-amino acid oxidase-like deaminating enzyme
MISKDYIIVGLGLAGLAFAEQLIKHNKTFVVFNDQSQNASKVAAGMFNPVILKRFTSVWNGKQQIDYAIPFYKNIEKRFVKKYIKFLEIHRILNSVAQQNDWVSACDKPVLAEYMIPEIFSNQNKYINAPLGIGKLTDTGKVETGELLNDYKNYLIRNNQYFEETFNYNDLKIEKQIVKYKNIKAKKIVFCEGFGVKKNPFFKDISLKEAKGELLIIKALKLKINYVLKGSLFIMPLENDLYKVGATYNWDDKTLKPTKKAKKELQEKLERMIDTNYSIVNQLAGIRPTVKDRRPLIGTHIKYKNLAILNGLGTRGVMLAPTMANHLYQYLEDKTNMDKTIDINRF